MTNLIQRVRMARPATRPAATPAPRPKNYGHTWLHPECWNVWHRERRSRAADALATMGIR